MSAGAIGWVYAHSTATRATFAVHLALADSANDMHNYELWARQQWIADKARVSRKSVNESLAWLTGHGFLLLVEPGRKGGAKGGSPNRYRLVMDGRDSVWKPRSDDEAMSPHVTSGGEAMSPHVTSDVTVGYTPMSPHVTQNPSSNPTRNPTSRGSSSNGRSERQAPVPASPARDEGAGEKRKRQLPEDWSPTNAHVSLAASLGAEIEREAEQFCDHHQARGSTFLDWDAAFRTWLRNAARFSASSPAGRAKTRLEKQDEVFERAARGQLRPGWEPGAAGNGIIEAIGR